MTRSFRKSLRASVRLWKGFRETPVNRARVIDFEVPKTLTVMGVITDLWYTTSHGRKAAKYGHHWQPTTRPLFCAAPDGRIFVIGGRYRATDRGVVDLDAHGRVMRVRGHGRKAVTRPRGARMR